MPPLGKIACCCAVAVAQQHGTTCLIGLNANAIAAQHIRAIGKWRDAAKPFGFALGGEQPTAHIQALQAGVAGGIQAHAGVQHPAGILRQGRQINYQFAVLVTPGLRGKSRAVDRQRLDLHRNSWPTQPLWRHISRTLNAQLGVDQGLPVEELKAQLNSINRPDRRLVVRQANQGFCAHSAPPPA